MDKLRLFAERLAQEIALSAQIPEPARTHAGRIRALKRAGLLPAKSGMPSTYCTKPEIPQPTPAKILRRRRKRGSPWPITWPFG